MDQKISMEKNNSNIMKDVTNSANSQLERLTNLTPEQKDEFMLDLSQADGGKSMRESVKIMLTEGEYFDDVRKTVAFDRNIAQGDQPVLFVELTDDQGNLRYEHNVYGITATQLRNSTTFVVSGTSKRISYPIDRINYKICTDVQISAIREQKNLPLEIAFNGGYQEGEFSFKLDRSRSVNLCRYLWNTSKLKVPRK